MSLEKLTKLDTRWIYLLFIIVTVAPLISPLGLPLKISDDTRIVFDTIDAVPEGGTVFFGSDMGMGNRGETQAMMVAVLRHLFTSDVKVISVCFYSSDSPILLEEAVNEIGLANYDKEYGVDFVNFGFYEGREATLVAFGVDAHAFLNVDYYGTPISELSIMDDFKGAEDIDLVISLSGGEIFPEVYLRQWQTIHGTKVTGGAVAMIYPMLVSYVASGQLSGLLASSRGAAEYELLINKPGSAIIAMDSQSLGHMVTILAIIISNLGYFASKRSKKGGLDI